MFRKASLKRVRLGFTLVELLVVIAIIGILVGLLVPAVIQALGAANRGTLKMDVDGIAGAVNQYRDKYNDYPPDGASWIVFERHIRKAFPGILDSELVLMNPATRSAQNSWSTAKIANDSEVAATVGDMRVMEPAEAIVFFLGGFSDDPQKPFTGAGGPFVATGNSSQPFQYNPSRSNAIFDFAANRLTLQLIGGFSVSNDEQLYTLPDAQNSGAQTLDLLPMYKSRYSEAPYVYFDSRTYSSNKGGARYYNRFAFFNATAKGIDTVRPYKSDVARNPSDANLDLRFKYMNDKTFQILSPGIDGIFGGAPTSAWNQAPVLFKFPSGTSDIADTTLSGYKHPAITIPRSPQYDNVGDFSRTTLEVGLQ